MTTSRPPASAGPAGSGRRRRRSSSSSCRARGPAGRRRRRPGWPAHGSARGSASAAAWPGACWSEAARRATSGRLKARVLPEPVRPRPRTSLPERLSGSVATWIGNGEVMPLRGEHLDQRRGDAEGGEGGVGRQHGGVGPDGDDDGRRDGGRRGLVAGRVVLGGLVAGGTAAATAAAAGRRGRLSPVPAADVGELLGEVIGSSTLRWPHEYLGERERRRTAHGAGRARIVGETSVSRAHLGGAASARRRFLPLRMSEGGAGT